MIKHCFYLSLFLSSFFVFSQEETDKNKFNFTTSIHAGTSGLGLDFKCIKTRYSLRVGYSMIPFHYNTTVDMGIPLLTDIKVNYNSVNAVYEFQPFKTLSWFRVGGGISYFVTAKEVATLNPRDALSTNSITLSPSEIGNINITADSKGVAPYLGVELGKLIPEKRFNVNFDLGSYFLPAPKVVVSGTKLLSNNQNLGNLLTDELKTYRWLPLIQINFNYLIK